MLLSPKHKIFRDKRKKLRLKHSKLSLQRKVVTLEALLRQVPWRPLPDYKLPVKTKLPLH